MRGNRVFEARKFDLGTANRMDDRAWRAEPPGGKGRTIAEIFAHIHNVRHMWLVVAAKELPIPEKLNRARKSFPETTVFPISFLSRAQYRSAWRRALHLHAEGTLWPPQSLYARNQSVR